MNNYFPIENQNQQFSIEAPGLYASFSGQQYNHISSQPFNKQMDLSFMNNVNNQNQYKSDSIINFNTHENSHNPFHTQSSTFDIKQQQGMSQMPSEIAINKEYSNSSTPLQEKVLRQQYDQSNNLTQIIPCPSTSTSSSIINMTPSNKGYVEQNLSLQQLPFQAQSSSISKFIPPLKLQKIQMNSQQQECQFGINNILQQGFLTPKNQRDIYNPPYNSHQSLLNFNYNPNLVMKTERPYVPKESPINIKISQNNPNSMIIQNKNEAIFYPSPNAETDQKKQALFIRPSNAMTSQSKSLERRSPSYQITPSKQKSSHHMLSFKKLQSPFTNMSYQNEVDQQSFQSTPKIKSSNLESMQTNQNLNFHTENHFQLPSNFPSSFQPHQWNGNSNELLMNSSTLKTPTPAPPVPIPNLSSLFIQSGIVNPISIYQKQCSIQNQINAKDNIEKQDWFKNPQEGTSPLEFISQGKYNSFNDLREENKSKNPQEINDFSCTSKNSNSMGFAFAQSNFSQGCHATSNSSINHDIFQQTSFNKITEEAFQQQDNYFLKSEPALKSHNHNLQSNKEQFDLYNEQTEYLLQENIKFLTKNNYFNHKINTQSDNNKLNNLNLLNNKVYTQDTYSIPQIHFDENKLQTSTKITPIKSDQTTTTQPLSESNKVLRIATNFNNSSTYLKEQNANDLLLPNNQTTIPLLDQINKFENKQNIHKYQINEVSDKIFNEGVKYSDNLTTEKNKSANIFSNQSFPQQIQIIPQLQYNFNFQERESNQQCFSFSQENFSQTIKERYNSAVKKEWINLSQIQNHQDINIIQDKIKDNSRLCSQSSEEEKIISFSEIKKFPNKDFTKQQENNLSQLKGKIKHILQNHKKKEQELTKKNQHLIKEVQVLKDELRKVKQLIQCFNPLQPPNNLFMPSHWNNNQFQEISALEISFQ